MVHVSSTCHPLRDQSPAGSTLWWSLPCIAVWKSPEKHLQPGYDFKFPGLCFFLFFFKKRKSKKRRRHCQTMAVGHSTAQGSITADPLQRQEIQATDARGSGGGGGGSQHYDALYLRLDVHQSHSLKRDSSTTVEFTTPKRGRSFPTPPPPPLFGMMLI